MSAGGWKGETPAPENQLIIDYLDAVRPVPSDEQYLPVFCDVVQLLEQLAGLGEGLAQVARTIARGILDFDVVNRDAKSVKEALKKLEVFVEQSTKVGGGGIEEGGKEGVVTEVVTGGEGSGDVEGDKEREKSGETEVKGTGGEGNETNKGNDRENACEAMSGEAKENGDERGARVKQ